MRVKKVGMFFCFVLATLLLSSCQPPPLYQNTLDKNTSVAQQMQDYKARMSTLPSGSSAPTTVNTNVLSSGDQPDWLYSHVSLHGNDLPLDLLMTKILGSTGVNSEYQLGIDKDQLVSINYSGDVRGALDKIAATNDYSYNIQDNVLTWSAFETRTFDISFMPGAAQYLMGQQAGDNANTVNMQTNGNVANGITTDSQYSNLQGTLSVWNDLQNSVHQMLSPDGTVVVSQSTTTITVRDHPQNVEVIADYLASMNKELSRQVLLKVCVLQVTLNKSFNYGIDWNVAFKTGVTGGISTGDLTGSTNPISGAYGPVGPIGGTFNPNGLSVAGISQGSLSIPGISAGVVSGPFANSQVLINALTQQGTVATITDPNVVTLNNQVAQIDISTDTTYLSSVSTTSISSVGSQTSLTPGVINSGFKLYILPKINGRNIYLQLSSELSTLDSLSNVSSGGNTIQLPVVSGKHFNLRSMVPSGCTLIVAGFKQINNSANQNTMFGSTLFGGTQAQQNNIETVVLITPILVGNS